MKFKVTTLALMLCAISASIALGAIRHVAPAGSNTFLIDHDGAGPQLIGDPNTCLFVGDPCLTISYAHGVADQGDTIKLIVGSYTPVAPIDLTKDYITIEGPNAGVTAIGRNTSFTDGPLACDAAEACIIGTTLPYLFSIQANNVKIDGFNLVGDITTTWAAVKIEGGYDRWTIDSNIIERVGQKKVGATGNYSYGIYGDANSVSGTATMTGNEIFRNRFVELGRQNLPGSNKTAGMGVHLEGTSGASASCTTLLKFDCGAWIHGNQFENLAVGQNVLNFTFDVNGKESSTAVNVIQDAENASPNNGVVVEANFYDDDAVDVKKLDRGVVIGVGDSRVTEDNAVMLADVDAYVTNIGRKATIDELVLADFYKTLNPTFYGPGSDVYYETLTLATDNSDPTASIVFLEQTSAAPDLYKITVTNGPDANTVSYKVSLDSAGDLNLRQGARLLFDGAKSDGITDGVTEVVLDGTIGDDLLTLDFNNGNPTPRADPGIVFDGMVGFDKIVLRGDEQLLHQTHQFSGPKAGKIFFEPAAGPGLSRSTFTLGTTTNVMFSNVEPIDDVLIVNGRYGVTAPDDVNNEINVINGPFRFGFDTFQINSGQEQTFNKINFANKKNVDVYGADNTVPGDTDADDVFTLFTEDGDAPNLLLNINMFGGDAAAGADASDDYFTVRPSKDFAISVSGGTDFVDDHVFLDCANTDALCDPLAIGGIVPGGGTYSAMSGVGFEDFVIAGDIELTAPAIATDLQIKKELVGFAADGAHPGDDIEYKVTVTNFAGGTVDLTTTPLWITDVVDHRLSLVEQSVVVTSGTVQVAGNNTAMLWRIDDDASFGVGESFTMTYTAIVNTLITTEDVHNYATILNPNTVHNQYVDNGAVYEDVAHADLDVLEVYGFPIKAAIQASLFYETEAGPRYMVGLYGGAKDPAQGNLGALLCRVPDTNYEVGWEGGLGNLWYSCGEGLPAKEGLFSPLVVTDMYQDSAGRIWLTTWGFEGLYYSDDGAQTWTSAGVDLSGGIGGAPDGLPDGFAQIYAITEDILGTLFISANNGEVYRSFDRGVTWQKAKQLPMGSADTAYSLQADPTVPGKIYAGTFGDGLYISQDFSETWVKPASAGLLNGYIYDIEIDPISGNLFVGTAKGIFYSSDDGANWTGLNAAFPFPTNPPEIRNIAFDGNGQLFASTWGQGVWSSADWQAASLSIFALKEAKVFDMAVSNGVVFTLAENGVTTSFRYSSSARSTGIDDGTDLEVPTDFALDQNYPNPFNPTTSIQFNLPASQNVNLSVFDVLGRRVATLVNGQMAAGRHNVTFEASSLPSGMYLYRLSTPNGSISQKMILMK